MKKWSAWPRILTVAIIGALFISVVADSNVYDKFRKRERTNKGYLSEADEVKLGAEVHQQVTQQFKLNQNRVLNDYVNTLGQRLASTSERPNLQWRFFVVDDKSINAFATLGGYVYVHTGLIAATKTEGQLASVMGHEIGHIVGRHGLENVKRAQKYGTLAGIMTITGAVLGGAGGANVGGLAGNLLAGGYLMKHSRDAEREADFLGVYNMNRAGYNTNGMVEMFNILGQISQSQPDTLGKIMASHPDPKERATNTRREIDQHLQGTDHRGLTTSDEYQEIKTGRAPVSADPGRRVRPRN
ncbi:MAG TPA: M48 family metallopeptidase [Blastocatellia bacterium]|nr:M48 family metallopeptidase [Blastocatellia bacterium]